MTNNKTLLTGREAIAYAAENDMLLNKYADPIEDARNGLTVREAQSVALEDPRLIWIARKREKAAITVKY